jgi:hypothetical protein
MRLRRADDLVLRTNRCYETAHKTVLPPRP